MFTVKQTIFVGGNLHKFFLSFKLPSHERYVFLPVFRPSSGISTWEHVKDCVFLHIFLCWNARRWSKSRPEIIVYSCIYSCVEMPDDGQNLGRKWLYILAYILVLKCPTMVKIQAEICSGAIWLSDWTCVLFCCTKSPPPRFLKQHCFMEALTVCRSTRATKWWNGTGRRTPKYLEKNHKSHKD